MSRFLRASAGFGAGLLIVWGLTQGGDASERTWLWVLAGAGVLLAFALWPSRSRALPAFGRAMLRWVSLLSVAFLLVSVQLVRVQIVDSGRTLDRVETTASGDVVMNPRRRLAEFDEWRGRILASDGTTLAETVRGEDGSWQRTWPEPSTWGLVGFYSPLLYGASNLEAAYDGVLSGQEGGSAAREWFNNLLHLDRKGNSVQLSLDIGLQRQAEALLDGRQGAVVLLDAKTGAVLAMAGGATADPNRLYAGDGNSTVDDFATVRAYWDELNADSNAPLLFRPTQGLYTPGSTFKTVTASAVVDLGEATPQTIYRDEGILNVDGRIIEEQNRPDPNQVDWTMEESYAYSLNIVFAQIGLQVGPDNLWEYAGRFGFGEEIPFDLPTAETQLVGERADLLNRALLADTAFGQGQILTSPLQMAMVVAAIANGGSMMQPWLAEYAISPDGEVVERYHHGEWRQAVSADTAQIVRQLMLASADYGYASAAAIPGATVGGKTGTAEVGEGEPHAWFTGFAEAGDRTLAVAVIVEHGGAGSQAALPIGRALLASALGLE